MAVFLQAVRIAAIALSFWGLCQAVGERLKLAPAFAPAVTASLIIIVLMAAGIARVLLYAWWALFAGGLACLAWSLIRGRLRFNWVVAALGLALVYAVFHFRNAFYTGNDSVSHWGLVARHLVTTDRFPDASAKLVFFRSYPLGTTCFLYYACRGIGALEGGFLAAMFMLHLICLLPICGLIRENRLLGGIIAAAAMTFLIRSLGIPTSLQVDAMLGCMTVGALAMVCDYRDDPWRALKATLPIAITLVVTKASGLFFAALILLALAWAARAVNLEWRGRRGVWRLLIIGLAASIAAFIVWQGHVRLTFGVENIGKHGFSLQSYARTSAQKTAGQVFTVVREMAKWLVWPPVKRRWARAVCLALYAVSYFAIRACRRDRDVWVRRLRRLFLASTILYLVWYLMLFLMYMFSMPIEEALSLASISRYEGTVMAIEVGLLAMFMLACFCGGGFAPGRKACVLTICALLAIICAPLAGTPWGRALARGVVRPERSDPKPFGPVLRLVRQGEVEPRKSYMLFCRHAEQKMDTVFYFIKYEMQTLDISVIGTDINVPGLGREYERDEYYYFDDVQQVGEMRVTHIDDMERFFDAYLDRYDYLILFNEDKAFEARLNGYIETHDVDTQVLYGY